MIESEMIRGGWWFLLGWGWCLAALHWMRFLAIYTGVYTGG